MVLSSFWWIKTHCCASWPSAHFYAYFSNVGLADAVGLLVEMPRIVTCCSAKTGDRLVDFRLGNKQKWSWWRNSSANHLLCLFATIMGNNHVVSCKTHWNHASNRCKSSTSEVLTLQCCWTRRYLLLQQISPINLYSIVCDSVRIPITTSKCQIISVGFPTQTLTNFVQTSTFHMSWNQLKPLSKMGAPMPSLYYRSSTCGESLK